MAKIKYIIRKSILEILYKVVIFLLLDMDIQQRSSLKVLYILYSSFLIS